LLETETEGKGAMGAAVADRAACGIEAPEMGMAIGNLLSVMEAIQTTDYGQTMIDGLRCGSWLLVQLMANIVQQGGLGDGSQGLMLALKPTSEVKQFIGVGAQRVRRQLPHMLGIEKIIHPDDLVVLLIEQAIRTGDSLEGGLMDQG
jgi:hypothetical protein